MSSAPSDFRLSQSSGPELADESAATPGSRGSGGETIRAPDPVVYAQEMADELYQYIRRDHENYPISVLKEAVAYLQRRLAQDERLYEASIGGNPTVETAKDALTDPDLDSAAGEDSGPVLPRPIVRPRVAMEIKINVSPELDARIDNMGEELGTTKGTTILTALELLGVALEAKREGKRIAILDDSDNSEQEIEI